MIPYVYIGERREFTLNHILLVYSEGKHHDFGDGGGRRTTYATLHHPLLTEGDGFVCGPGRPVTMDFVRELSRGLGHSVDAACLPSNILCYTHDVVAWWSRPRVQTLFWSREEAKDLNGEDFPIPGLVWVLRDGSSLSVRALATEGRPEPDTPAYVAPFYNTNDRGTVCQGTMRRPDRTSIATLGKWEDGYFGAAFTHPTAQRLTTHRRGPLPMWRSLRKKTVFPTRYLVDAGTVDSFIRGVF